MSRIERLSGRTKIALSAASQTLGNVFVALGAVLILRLTTHRLGTADYGLFALVITYVSLFSLLADLGITAMTTRELARTLSERTSVLGVAISSRVVLSLMTIPLILGTAQLIYPHKSELFHIAVAVMSLDVLFTAIQTTANTAFAVEIRGDVIAIIAVINRSLYLLGVVLTVLLHGSYFGFVCAYVGADFVTAFGAAVAARRRIAFGWNWNVRAWWRTTVQALPLGFLQVVENVYSWVDSILLSVLRSTSQVGFYSVAFNAINVMGVIPGSLMQALIPSLVNADLEEISRLVNKAVYVLYCVGTLIAVAGVILRTEIVMILAGPRFLSANTSLAILTVSLPFSFVQTALNYTSFSIDRYRSLVVVTIATLLFNVTINFALIPKFGASGAAAALLASEIVALFATYRVFRRLSGVQVAWSTLWRPTLAGASTLSLIAVRNSLWSHFFPPVALLVGGCLVVIVYVLVLSVVRGMPPEVTGFLRWRRAKHARKRGRT